MLVCVYARWCIIMHSILFKACISFSFERFLSPRLWNVIPSTILLYWSSELRRMRRTARFLYMYYYDSHRGSARHVPVFGNFDSDHVNFTYIRNIYETILWEAATRFRYMWLYYENRISQMLWLYNNIRLSISYDHWRKWDRQ